MSAAGSSAINGASRGLAARAGPTAASSCTTTAKATKREMRDRYPARCMTALLLGDVGYGLIRPYGPGGHAGLRGAPGEGSGGPGARAGVVSRSPRRRSGLAGIVGNGTEIGAPARDRGPVAIRGTATRH